jgi:glycine cleavage system regulatory protein
MPSSSLYVIATTGSDQPGILAAICDALSAVDCSLADSRVLRLAGMFNGILVVSAPPGIGLNELDQVMSPLRRLNVHVEIKQLDARAPVSRHTPGTHAFIISCSGADEPGIVRGLTHALTNMGCEFVDMNTHVRSTNKGTEFILVCEVDAPKHYTLKHMKTIVDGMATQLGLEFLVVPADLEDLDRLLAGEEI